MSIGDLLSAWVLWRTWSREAALFFLLLSPAAVIISGYHGNSEPLIMALAALSYWRYSRTEVEENNPGQFPTDSFVLLGCCLGIKHIFVLLPLWIFFRQKSWRDRIRALAIPYGTWISFFIPFLVTDPIAVVKNVLLYSWNSGGSAIPMLIQWVLEKFQLGEFAIRLRPYWTLVFLACMLIAGWKFRTARWKYAFAA
ncbi:MAG TPA: hypothetical protein VJB59_15715 [Bdellovibrionota bacterium]|nr:hypothetical protein [Bdellovibrionota bacterium]